MSATTTKTIKLATNIPLVGVLKYVDFAKSKTEGWGDQICLKGHFDGHGEGRVYLADWLAKTMIENAIIETNGNDRDGNQAYRVICPGRVQILREEHGTKKVTTILPVGEAASPAAGAVSPPPAASPVGAAAKEVRATSAPVPLSTQDDAWLAVAHQYTRAVETAAKVWANFNLPPDALVAAAATVFIEANKRGLTVPAPHVPLTAEQKAANVRDAFDRYATKPGAIANGERGDADEDPGLDQPPPWAFG